MQIDVRSAYLFAGLLFVILSLGTWLSTTGLRNTAVRLWCGGSTLYGLGFVLISLRGVLPEFFTFYLAICCAVFGLAALALSLQSIEPSRPRRTMMLRRGLVLACVVFLLIFFYMVHFRVNEVIRVTATTSFQLILSFSILAFALRLRRTTKTRSSQLLVLMGIGLTAAFGARVLGLVSGLGGMGVFVAAFDHTIGFVGLVAASVLGNFGFMQLQIEKLAIDRQAITQSLAASGEKVNALANLVRQRNELAIALESSSRISSLGMFGAAVVHEISQPLTAMRMNLEFLRKHTATTATTDPGLQAALIDLVNDQERTAKIIDNLRNLYLLTESEGEPLELSGLVSETMQTLQHAATKKGILITEHYTSEPLWILGNQTQMQQVVVNLISNSIWACEQSGGKSIWVHTSQQGESAVLEVIDTGCGFPEGKIETLFAPLHTTKTSGMGLGLPICRSILEGHKGSIEAINLSGGARFRVVLPLATMQPNGELAERLNAPVLKTGEGATPP
jgi:signal transduction histidine kinase